MAEVQRYRVDQLLRLACGILKLSPDVVLRRARLPASYLSEGDKGATAEEYFALWSAMEETYGQADLPERLGITIAHGPFVPAFFAFSCSSDLRTGLERLAQFKPLVGPIALEMEVRSEGYCIEVRPTQSILPMSDVQSATEAVLLLELFRTHTATPIAPVSVSLPQPVAQDFFGCPQTVSRFPRLTLTLEDAYRPLISENAEMWNMFEPNLRRQLAETLATSSVSDRLRNALLEAIPSGETGIHDLAEKLHMSKRSLQRHLSAEDTNYREVLDRTRADLARHYLGATGTSLDEVSYLLGYSNPASFFRAFQSWFGMTPSGFRSAQNALA